MPLDKLMQSTGNAAGSSSLEIPEFSRDSINCPQYRSPAQKQELETVVALASVKFVRRNL